MSDEPTPTFTQVESQYLVSALLEGEGRGVSTGEIEAFYSWCEQIRVQAAIVNLIVTGRLLARWSAEDDDWHFTVRPT
jgi:hypothetical protein